MIETLIIAMLLFFFFALFIYFNIKSKDLSIQLLTKEEAKKVFENLLENTKEDLIKVEQKFENEKQSLIEFKKENALIVNSFDKLKREHLELQATFTSKIKEAVEAARADSTKRQRSILKGQATEHLAPYINSQYNPKDYKFVGDPIDYIIYDGLSDIKTKEDSINKIVLMDIKTGKSQLNRAQRAIKKCVQEGNVEFEIYRPEKDIKNQQDSNE